MRVVAMDDPRRVLPPGETGEIAVRGPNVFKGYWNRPEDTARAFVEGGWFLTGDVGRMDPDGYFFLTERKKDMILTSGFNVYPSVIEAAIHEHPEVLEAAVIGIPDPYRGQSAKAFVTLTLEALQAFLAERVGRHEMPVALEVRGELPKTPVGKLTKLPLIEEEAARHGPAAPAPA
jgi:long-chain acyl-CoA synthetase